MRRRAFVSLPDNRVLDQAGEHAGCTALRFFADNLARRPAGNQYATDAQRRRLPGKNRQSAQGRPHTAWVTAPKFDGQCRTDDYRRSSRCLHGVRLPQLQPRSSETSPPWGKETKPTLTDRPPRMIPLFKSDLNGFLSPQRLPGPPSRIRMAPTPSASRSSARKAT
jgi:hypothetical protein